MAIAFYKRDWASWEVIGPNMEYEAILKKTSVSGVAAGWFKRCEWELFFIFFPFFSPKNGQYFPTNKNIKGGGGKAASLLASKKDTCWTGNRSFF